MEEKIIVNIKNIAEIKDYDKLLIKNFLVPLEDFCVGYDEVSLTDVLKISNAYYLLINRILTKDDLVKLEKILCQINNNLKGIFFEDLGVLEVIKKINKNLEKIYFPNHFATNYLSVNVFLKRGIDSIIISNEITYEEIEKIVNNSLKEVILQVYGYNQIMYSRRNLISNFNQEFSLNLPLNNEITERVTKKELKIKENKWGTVIFDENIYNNLKLLNLKKNIKFYYINTTYLSVKQIKEALKNKEEGQEKSFLNKKTVYKIGDLNE